MEGVNAFIVWWLELKIVQKLNQEVMPPLHVTAAFGACIETRDGNKQNKRERFVPPHESSILLGEICLIIPLKVEKFMQG